MKTATVRDLRNSFARVSRWIEAGETVELTKRGRVIAHLLPTASRKGKPAPKPDILARLKADFGDAIISDQVYHEIMRNTGSHDDDRLS